MALEIKGGVTQHKVPRFRKPNLAERKERQFLVLNNLETALSELHKTQEELDVEYLPAVPLELEEGGDGHDVEGRADQVGVDLELPVNRYFEFGHQRPVLVSDQLSRGLRYI